MEFCLGIKPYMQPYPLKNPQGDCFACALTATLQHLFPENPPDFERVWNYFVGKYYQSDKDCLQNTWTGMRKAFLNAEQDGYPLDFTTDIVKPEFDLEIWSYAWWQFCPDQSYNLRLEGWLRMGYVAITEVDLEGKGTYHSDTGRCGRINHFVVLDGVKTVWEDSENCRSKENYVHVVCSVKGSYWIKTQDFLTKYGGSGWRLVAKERQ